MTAIATSLQCLVLIFLIFLPGSSQAASWWNCDWIYRTEINVSASVSASNHAVRLELESADFNTLYPFTSDGNDIRVVDSDDATALDFFLEHWDSVSRSAILNVNIPSVSPSATTIYIYYGTSDSEVAVVPPPASNAVTTFVESGWRIHTRTTTIDPTNEAEARAVFDSIDDSTGGFGCATIDTLNGRNNRNTFSGPNGNYGLYNEVYFNVDFPGLWSFRFGGDYGRGGGLYVDSQPLDERWNDDLWWAFNYNNPDVLSGTVYLDTGYHHIETLGFESCCDGSINMQFQEPASTVWQDMSSTNIELAGRSCPPGIINDTLVESVSPSFFGGSVFLDNGISGTAHDGVRTAGEIGVESISVTTTVVATGNSLTDQSASDGSWSVCFLDQAGGSNIIVDTSIPSPYFHISENVTATNLSPAADATIEFTATTNTDYNAINFGLIEPPTLSADRVISIAPDNSDTLAHEYVASSAAEVSFQISQLEHELPQSFTVTSHLDVDCNGIAEQPPVPLNNPITVVAGDSICIVIELTAGSQVNTGTRLKLQIDAVSDFTGIDLTELTQNIDLINGNGSSKLTLQKQACNITHSVCDLLTGSGFGFYNTGKPGDTLEYRLVFSSIDSSVSEVTVFDSVPAFTTLEPLSITLEKSPAGASCTLIKPISQNLPDYNGDIEYQCIGNINASDQGIIGFRVIVD